MVVRAPMSFFSFFRASYIIVATPHKKIVTVAGFYFSIFLRGAVAPPDFMGGTLWLQHSLLESAPFSVQIFSQFFGMELGDATDFGELP